MTHLHLPDGILPFWLWASGLALSGLLIAVCARAASAGEFRRRLPLLSMTAAFMIISMSIPVIPAVYHVQLAGLAGIVLAPALGGIAIFVVNLLLALLGHGGITVVGLNTLILGSEMLAAWALFRMTRGRMAPGAAAGLATFLAMMVGAGVMLGIVALATPRAGLAHLEEVTGFDLGRHHHAHSLYAAVPYEKLSLRRLWLLVAGVGSLGWLLEAMVTGVIVRFAARVKPVLVGFGPAHERL